MELVERRASCSAPPGSFSVPELTQRGPLVQAKLELSQPEDACEKEADAIAEVVTRLEGPQIRRQAASQIRRRWSEVLREHRKGRGVTIVADLGARAFTIGNHIVFGQGQFDPHSREGRRLLAHELTHVVQQARHRRGVMLQSRRP
ncbi:MAG: DUF4157 domain-containing protein [Acidobacteriota bacterium]